MPDLLPTRPVLFEPVYSVMPRRLCNMDELELRWCKLGAFSLEVTTDYLGELEHKTDKSRSFLENLDKRLPYVRHLETFPYYRDESLTPKIMQMLRKTILEKAQHLTSLSLQRFCVSDASLGVLVDWLQSQQGMARVEFDDCFGIALEQVAMMSEPSIALSELIFRSSIICTGYRDLDLATAFGKILQSNTTLRHLGAEMTSITCRDIDTFTSKLPGPNCDDGGGFDVDGPGWLLRGPTALRSLSLSSSDISSYGIEALASALAANANTRLAVLDLGSNCIRDSGAAALARALEPNTTSLHSLDLSMGAIGARGAEALANVLKSNSTLTSLNLSYNDISTKGVAAITAALTSNTTLKHLNLSKTYTDQLQGTKNSRAHAHAHAHASPLDALASNKSLESLSLACNGIGEKGAEALCKMLRSPTNKLVSLDLAGNDIRLSSDGGVHLLTAVAQSVTLETFDVSRAITTDGQGDLQWPWTAAGLVGKTFAQVLASNRSLKILRLANCGIDEDGARALAKAILYNPPQ